MSDKPRLYDEWLAFHEINPEIYRLVCRYADEVLARGYKEYAIATIWERIRWHMSIEMRSEFKLPNNHRAYYARFWADNHPQHAGFFKLCTLRSENEDLPFDRWGRGDDPKDDG